MTSQPHRTAVIADPNVSLAPLVRIAPGADGVSIWSPALFGETSPSRLRAFLASVFSVAEVAAVEIRRDEAFGRISYAQVVDPHATWRKLAGALRQATVETPNDGSTTPGAGALFLDGPRNLPLEIRRAGGALSSWRVRYLSGRRVRLSHPILRRRRDVAFRLEEALAGVLGVTSFRTNTVSGTVVVRLDPRRLSSEALVRHVEQFWPALLNGLDGPPSNARLYAAGGLLGIAATGQFFVPALRPAALLGVVIYSSTNVVTAFRQLLRGQVGLPAMYSFGLGLLLLSGMPFNSTIFAVLMQSWPRLARRDFVRSQRRLFAAHRQQPTWARLWRSNGTELDVDVATLREGDIVAIRSGEVVPVDGTVHEGLAAIDEQSLSGVAGAIDKRPGDRVYATGYLRDGNVLVRVHATAGGTVAAAIARLLPHDELDDLPSAAEAERVANRNAKPALALAVASIVSRQLVRPAQAVIRPDYITATRLGAQLAALHALGHALNQGIVFRRPRALDLLAATDIYVIDDSDVLEQRRIAIAEVFVARDVAAIEVVRAAAAAFPPLQNERVRALHERGQTIDDDLPPIFRRRRVAGAVRYADDHGREVDVAAAPLETSAAAALPATLREAIRRSPHAAAFDATTTPRDHLLRPLVIRRDGRVLGAIAFERSNVHEAAQAFSQLRAINPRARFVHVSSRSQAEADATARLLGIDTALGHLDAVGKARILRELGPRAVWIGDGSRSGSAAAIGAASVSLSVGGFATIGQDEADVVFLHASFANLLQLRRVVTQHRARLDGDYRAVYAANFVGVAGGLFANFGGLQSGIASNAGTALVYWQHRQRLRALVDRFAYQRMLLETPGREQEGHPGQIAVGATEAEPFYESPTRTAPNQPTEKADGV